MLIGYWSAWHMWSNTMWFTDRSYQMWDAFRYATNVEKKCIQTFHTHATTQGQRVSITGENVRVRKDVGTPFVQFVARTWFQEHIMFATLTWIRWYSLCHQTQRCVLMQLWTWCLRIIQLYNHNHRSEHHTHMVNHHYLHHHHPLAIVLSSSTSSRSRRRQVLGCSQRRRPEERQNLSCDEFRNENRRATNN